MCHQSVGLIARTIEAAGIPTLSLTSAWSITAAAGAPRGAFVNYPLGHTSGMPHDPAGQDQLLRDALACFGTITTPGTIVDLGLDWGEERWRDHPLAGAARTASDAEDGSRAGDTRVERFDTPQYQSERDRRLAEDRLGPEVACRACVGFDT
ncbi:MAG: hypothetical protein ACKV2O_18385 [Acidimicrobiales bacterium]